MERRTLSERLVNHFVFGAIALSVSSSAYLIGNYCLLRITADKIVIKESKTPIQSRIVFYGFDRDGKNS
ncbi:hypothetical protein HYV50_03120 [Candidatus Pacearchaeota archaeon]|nr:hypothetical protein [Candidatus Pacearchaeota archaeon]